MALMRHHPFFEVEPHHYGYMGEIRREINRLNRIVDDMTAPVHGFGEQFLQTGVRGSYVNDKEHFHVGVDVSQFAPEEISVRTDENTLTIEGKHEERADEHGFVSRQFVRRYTLPEDIDPQQLKSKLTSHGVLLIDAPKQAALEAPKERSIAIAHSGKSQKALEGGAL